MTEQDIPAATTIGAGLVLDDMDQVNIVLMLGDSDEDGDNQTIMAAIALNPGAAEILHGKLGRLITDCASAQEAVDQMGRPAAEEYLRNWQKRIDADYN